MKKRPTITLGDKDYQRLIVACRSIGTSRQEFIVFAVRQALDEIEALAREYAESD